MVASNDLRRKARVLWRRPCYEAVKPAKMNGKSSFPANVFSIARELKKKYKDFSHHNCS
jgi:hypothetical protein